MRITEGNWRPKIKENNMEQGKVQIYTGEGKGKTTAALGNALRGAGRGMKVVFIQFLKGEESGEIKILKHIPNIEYIKININTKFWFQMDSEERKIYAEEVKKGLERSEIMARSGRYDIVILDEIVCCGDMEIVSRESIENLIKIRNRTSELILTGRGAWQSLIELGDTVTEMKKIKHCYDDGVPARMGIEF